MANGFMAKLRGKSADAKLSIKGISAPHTAQHGADRVELAYQVQAAEQAHAALRGRLDDGKAFSEEWMRMYVRRGA